MIQSSSVLRACLAVVLALAPAAALAQQPHAKAATHHPVPVAIPTPAPAITVAPESDEDNEPSPPVDKGSNTTPDGAAPQTTETEILATDGATFASKDRIAVFTGNVRVNDARFKLACDKLTVFLNKTGPVAGAAPGPAGASPAPTPAPTPTPTPPPLAADGKAPAGAAPAPTPGSSGGIDHAIAEGHVIIVQERAAQPGSEAKKSIGRGDWANFDNKTGDMVLKGMPSVEQNGNTHVATSPATVMTLRKDNSLSTVGPSVTKIIQRKGSELPGSDLGGPAPAQPGQSPAPARKPAAGSKG